jgi:hypothetical protein
LASTAARAGIGIGIAVLCLLAVLVLFLLKRKSDDNPDEMSHQIDATDEGTTCDDFCEEELDWDAHSFEQTDSDLLFGGSVDEESL